MRRFTFRLAALFPAICLAASAVAQTSPDVPQPADMRPFAAKAAQLFNPDFMTQPGSDLNTTCANVLLCFQAISATLIVAAMVNHIRQSRTQMDGVASTLIKVAFIATIPTWRTVCLDTANVAAGAFGYQAITANGAPSTLMNDMWGLLGQWVPASTPYFDALESQDANNAPPSGQEQEWGLRAWNWARGVGAADAALFPSLWQATSGGVRAAIVFGSSGLMVCAVSLTIVLSYFGEMIRYLLFYGGCAMLPVFIAGLGIDALRAQAVKAILALVSIAFWPVGWALANIVTHVVAQGAQQWMSEVAARTLTAAGMQPAPLGIAAPYVAWGVLFLFLGVTMAVCLWMVACVFYVPVVMTRAVSGGTVMMSRLFSGSLIEREHTLVSTPVPEPAILANSPLRFRGALSGSSIDSSATWRSTRMHAAADRAAPSMAESRRPAAGGRLRFSAGRN